MQICAALTRVRRKLSILGKSLAFRRRRPVPFAVSAKTVYCFFFCPTGIARELSGITPLPSETPRRVRAGFSHSEFFFFLNIILYDFFCTPPTGPDKKKKRGKKRYDQKTWRHTFYPPQRRSF